MYPQNIILKYSKIIRFDYLGAPASGKGTLCEAIIKDYQVVHLSTGEILREAISQETGM